MWRTSPRFSTSSLVPFFCQILLSHITGHDQLIWPTLWSTAKFLGVKNLSDFPLPLINARKHSLRRLCFYKCLSVHRGGGCIPACLAGHMTSQQYISRCTVDGSQLVWRQHTGNIKCMMGKVTWPPR